MLVVEGAKNRKQKSLPPGIEGVTSVIDYYIDSVNYKLAADLDFDPEANVFGIIEIQRTAAKMSQEKLKIKKA
jgi:hypothetical protein